ncbi:hypothetical protein EV646_116154 [Kribbella antiqua]|uniref:Uncharacterized protein n=1 Tax=Kribbella antiqua TaxID=2512217 RepID=A0A4R2IAD4_9ACTN|nr:hypothetical protein EV646_116154 [Kribbella antiqua]
MTCADTPRIRDFRSVGCSGPQGWTLWSRFVRALA